MENGTANKVGAASIHINPMFNGGNKNKPPVITNQPQVISPVNDGVSSLPSTPARVRTQSEPRTGTSRRTRANSTGNVSHSHERKPNQGLTDSYETVRIPRHLSAGNVSHQQRQGAHSDYFSQNKSPAKTLPRERSTTGNDQFCHSPVRNHLQLPQGGGATLSLVNGASEITNNGHQQHSPSRSIPNGSVLNQYPSTSGKRPQTQVGIARQLSPSKSPQHGPCGKHVNSPATTDYHSNTLSAVSGEMKFGSAPETSLPHLRAKQTPLTKLSDFKNTSLGEEKNLGAQTPYSSHRETGKATRNWGEEETFNTFVPNIRTNPNFKKPEDLWQKPEEATIEKKGSSTWMSGSERDNIPGDLLQRRSVSSETTATHKRNASKGTLRAPSMGELLSPLDTLPDACPNNTSLRYSERQLGNNNQSLSYLQSFPPPPPDMPMDSSDDDLYSIVAKGTYSSAVPDLHLRHCTVANSDRRERKSKNKHVYMVVPSGDGSTAV